MTGQTFNSWESFHMVDLTVVNPTNHSFPVGTNVNAPCQIGIITIGNPSIGSGTLQTFTSSSAVASGTYSISFPVSGSGDWSVNMTAQPDGTWNVAFNLTGTFAGKSQNFVANAVQQGNSVAFTEVSDPSDVITLSQNNGGLFTNGKINISLSTASMSLYLYNPE